MKYTVTVLMALLGMSGGAWAQSLLDQTSQGAVSGLGPYDPPRPLPFKKHDSIQVLVQERSRASSVPESLPTDLTLAIAAEVADVRPNGTLVIQAIKRHKLNGNEGVIKLTAEVAPQWILGNKVGSDKLMNLNLLYATSGSELTSEAAGSAKKLDSRQRSP
jgi:hypothetical protein